MLSKQALSTAADQVANMEARGVIVAPIPGSILDTVVRACHVPPDPAWRESDGTYRLDVGSLEYYASTKDSVTGCCEHDQTQGEIAEMLGQKVVGYLSHARTVVGVAVEDFVKNLEEALTPFRGQIAHDFEIVTQGLPGPMADKALLDAIQKAEDVVASDFDLPMVFLGSMSAGQVRELLHTGSAGLDANIDSWANALGDEALVRAWNQFFGDAPQSRASLVFNDTNEGNNCLLLAFLMAKSLYDNPPEGTNVSLNRFNEKIFDLRVQAAARLVARMDKIKSAEKNGALVISSFGRRIVVNTSVYTKWIKAGGEVEVLFGNALRTMPYSMIEDIDANAEEAKKSWARYAAMKKLDFDNRMFNKYKDLAKIEFARIMAEATNDEMPMVERDEIAKRFDAALACSVIDETKDLYGWGLRLLATSWFYKSDAYLILKTVCDIKKASPDMEPAEAAALAAIKYISYWVSGQMMIKRPGI